MVTDVGGRKPLRMIDLRYVKETVLFRQSTDQDEALISVKVPHEIDLVCNFTYIRLRYHTKFFICVSYQFYLNK